MADWRCSEAGRILLAAFTAWRAAGHTTIPVERALECGREAPDPVLADWAVESAGVKLADAVAKGRPFNPVGWVFVVMGLGESRSGHGPRKPSSPPLWVAKRWEPREAERRKLVRMQAAIEMRRLEFARAATQPDAGRGGRLGEPAPRSAMGRGFRQDATRAIVGDLGAG